MYMDPKLSGSIPVLIRLMTCIIFDCMVTHEYISFNEFQLRCLQCYVVTCTNICLTKVAAAVYEN